MKLNFLLFIALSFILLTFNVEAQTKRSTTKTKAIKPVKTQTTKSTNDVQAQAAISIWYDLNALCRGGSGDSDETMVACCTRTKVSALLNEMGYCYRTGERWVKCTARDKRAVPSTERCYD